MKKGIALLYRFKIYINNSAWVLLGMVLRMLITVFIISQIANKIGPFNFGWYNFSISVFTVLFSISTLGLNSSFIIKYLVNKENDISSILGTAIIGRILFSISLLVLFSFWIIFTAADSYYWIVLLACSSIVFQVSDLFVAYYQWKLKANVYVGVNIATLIIISTLLILGLYLNLGLMYFIFIYALERLLILIGLAVIFHREEFSITNFKFNYDLFKSLLLQSWPLLLGALLTALYSRFDQFLIKYFLDEERIGIYGTAIILVQIWAVVPSLIIPILYPKIAETKRVGDFKNYNKVIILLYSILNYLSLGVIAFITLFGNRIIIQLYGNDYQESIAILNILIWTLLILFQSHLTTSVMIIEGREKYLFLVKFIGVAVNIVLNVMFLSVYGIVFAAYSLLLSSFISWIALAFFDSKMRMLFIFNLRSFTVPFQLKKYI